MTLLSMRIKTSRTGALAVGLTMCLLMTAGCGNGDSDGTTPPEGGDAQPADTTDGSTTGDSDLGTSAGDLVVAGGGAAPSAGDSAADSGADAEPLAVQTFKELYEDRSVYREFQAKVYPDRRVRHGPYTEYHPGGSVVFERGEYEDGLRIGNWTRRYANDTLGKEGEYIGGEPHGVWKTYREDGSLQYEETYDRGEPDGKWTDYFDDGTSPSQIRHFGNDQRTGTWTRWYTPEQKAVEFAYKDGKLEGRRTTWYPDGKVAQVETFVGGKRNGPYEAYNKDGEKVIDAEYKDDRRVETTRN